MAVDEFGGIFYKIWMNERYPNDWTDGNIVKSPRKGELGLCGNCRGITLILIQKMYMYLE